MNEEIQLSEKQIRQEKIEKLQSIIHEIDIEMDDIQIMLQDDEENEELIDRYYELDDKKYELQQEIKFLKHQVNVKDGIINNLPNWIKCFICLQIMLLLPTAIIYQFSSGINNLLGTYAYEWLITLTEDGIYFIYYFDLTILFFLNLVVTIIILFVKTKHKTFERNVMYGILGTQVLLTIINLLLLVLQ